MWLNSDMKREVRTQVTIYFYFISAVSFNIADNRVNNLYSSRFTTVTQLFWTEFPYIGINGLVFITTKKNVA